MRNIQADLLRNKEREREKKKVFRLRLRFFFLLSFEKKNLSLCSIIEKTFGQRRERENKRETTTTNLVD
jgi:hypothetical protein